MVTRGKDGGRDSQGVWDGHGHTAVFNMENQQGPAGQLSVMWQPGGEGSLGENGQYFIIMVLEKTLESPLDCKKIKQVHPKGNQP